MTRPLVVLGATGSIGTQTLEVAEALEIPVAAVASRNPSPDLTRIGERLPDALVVVTGGTSDERDGLRGRLGDRVRFGSEAVLEISALTGVTVVNGIVGSAGLGASMAALEAGNRLALANKESMVAAGELVNRALQDGGGELIPVDSEHSALFQCLEGERIADVDRLVLTASGGPFRGMAREELAGVTPEQALDHPTWDMGKRITIDSATLFNKGLEVIEAHYLFDVPYDRIDVVVHPQSILHSAVAFVDGSWKGHIGHADMRIPIQFAITAPAREPTPTPEFSLAGLELSFEEPDRANFPALDLAYEAGRKGGSAPAVLNAADEVAVDAFLRGRLGFLGIPEIVERTMDQVEWRQPETIEEVIDVDSEARAVAAGMIAGSC